MDKVNQKFKFILPLVYKKGEKKNELWDLAGNVTICGTAKDTFGAEFTIEDIRKDGQSVKLLFDFFRATSYTSCDFIDEACQAHIVKLFNSDEDLALAMAVQDVDLNESLLNAIWSINRDYGNNIINEPKLLGK